MALPVADQKSAGSVVWTTVPQRMQKKSPSRTPTRPSSVERHGSATRKRNRPLDDVDGPFTGHLSCKKRRLRRNLITSRLSRPFSLPATHILNRETTAGGEMFLRRAATATPNVCHPAPDRGIMEKDVQFGGMIQARKLYGHGPSELVHRVAVLNRLRRKFSDEAEARSESAIDRLYDSKPTDMAIAELKDKTRPYEPAAKEVVSYSSRTTAESESSGERGPASPRSSRSPELRAVQTQTSSRLPTSEEIVEDYSLSFPTSSYIEDLADVEEVYADFGVIFGVPGENDDNNTARERDVVAGSVHAAEYLEDYMDDVDGIPPEAR